MSIRRLAVPVLIGAGVFFLVAAALLRFYAYPQVAEAPADVNSTTYLEARDATIFDQRPEVLEEITTDLEVRAKTTGDVEETEKAPEDVVVYVQTQVVESADGVERSSSTEKVALHKVTAEAVNCCNTFTSTRKGEQLPVERDGLVVKFPFDTQKRDYEVWDNTLKDTATAVYKGEDEIEGLEVYRFEMTVPNQIVGERPDTPASILGLGQQGNVTADIAYTLHRTIYVEPNTGAIIHDIRDQKQALVYDGEERLTMTDATIQYTADQVKDNVEEYGTTGPLLGNVSGPFTLVGLVLGLLLVLAGVVLRRRGYDA